MNIFNELGNIYFEIDNLYATKEFDAHVKGHIGRQLQFQRKRALNDQAYFLFMFSRLEDRIKTLSENLIKRKVANISNYKNNRAWNIIEDKQLNLMQKTSFLTRHAGTDYNLIFKYKKHRDTIAHGGLITIINMPGIISDFHRIYNTLWK